MSLEKAVIIGVVAVIFFGTSGTIASHWMSYNQTLEFRKMESEETKLAIQTGLQQCVDNDKMVWKKDCVPFE